MNRVKTDHLGSCKFCFSVSELHQLPLKMGKEVVFAGRSNSGKSSVLNAITGQKSLARSSKTPGRTQHINFFSVEGSKFLVDLPGYGYAKAPKTLKKSWENLLTNYVTARTQICGLVLIMDIRHPLQEKDLLLLDVFLPTGKPIICLLNKADKISKQRFKGAEIKVAKTIQFHSANFKVVSFSDTRGIGLAMARKTIIKWLEL